MATRRERINVGEKAEKGYLTTTAAAFLYVLDSSYKVVVAFDLNGRWQCAGELPSAQPPARSTREELDSKEVLKHARSQQAATAVRMRRSEEKEARILQQFTKTL